MIIFNNIFNPYCWILGSLYCTQIMNLFLLQNHPQRHMKIIHNLWQVVRQVVNNFHNLFLLSLFHSCFLGVLIIHCSISILFFTTIKDVLTIPNYLKRSIFKNTTLCYIKVTYNSILIYFLQHVNLLFRSKSLSHRQR